MTTIKWSSSASSPGDWSTPGNWVGGVVPTSTDAVVFDDTGSDFDTITLTTSQAAASVLLNTPGGAATLLFSSGGTLSLGGGTFTLDAGIVQLNGGGELKSATFVDAGGSVNFAGGTLDAVTWKGLLDLSGANAGLNILGGLTVQTAAGGSPGTINLTGSNAILAFDDTETLNNVTLNFGASGNSTAVNAQALTGQQLTFGAAATVNVAGNAGLNYFTFNNNGQISLTASTSILTLAGSGSTQSFSNTGTIAINTGTLALDGNETVASLGNITSTGGELFIGGTLDNTANTVTVVSGGAFGNTLLQGTLKGGTVVDTSGKFLIGGGTLDGVTWKGTLDLATVPGQSVAIKDGITLETSAGGTPGALNIGASSSVSMRDAETLSNVVVTLGNSAGGASLSAGNFVLTLASTTTVNAGGSGNNFSNINQGTLSNAGTINVSNTADLSITTVSTSTSGQINITSGGTLQLGASGGTFVNTGAIALGGSPSTLIFAANETVAQLGAVTSTGGLVIVNGTLDNTSNTLTLDTGSALANLELSTQGTLKGGTIDEKNAAVVFNNGTLNGVAWQGSIDLSVVNPNVFAGRLVVVGGLTVTAQGGGTGTIDITGQSSSLTFADTETLSGVVVNLGATIGGSSTLSGFGSGSLTLAATDTLVVNTGGGFGSAVLTGSLITNRAAINNTGGNFNISGTQFNNAGSISDSAAGATLDVNATTFNNGSQVSVTGGAKFLLASANVTNTGTISIDGSSTLEIANALSNAGNLNFLAGGGIIKVDALTNFSAHVTGWAAGDEFVFGTNASAPFSLGAGSTGNTLIIQDAGTTVGTLDVVGTFPYQLNQFSFSGNILSTTAMPCFAAGSRLLTDRGEVAVEALREGDRVATLAPGGVVFKPVRWIGHTPVDLERHVRPDAVTPVRVVAGAFGDALPHRDLVLSPDHAVFLRAGEAGFAADALVAVHRLVNGSTIRREPCVGTVVYYHVELERHGVLLAHGLPVESYLDTGNRRMFGHGSSIPLHPVFETTAEAAWAAGGCAPLIEDAALLAEVRARLAARAAALGAAARAEAVLTLATAGVAAIEVPAGCAALRLLAPTTHVAGDRRALGALLRAIRVDGTALALDGPALESGAHEVECHDGRTVRWISGEAVLVFEAAARARIVEVDVASLPAADELRRAA